MEFVRTDMSAEVVGPEDYSISTMSMLQTPDV